MNYNYYLYYYKIQNGIANRRKGRSVLIWVCVMVFLAQCETNIWTKWWLPSFRIIEHEYIFFYLFIFNLISSPFGQLAFVFECIINQNQRLQSKEEILLPVYWIVSSFAFYFIFFFFLWKYGAGQSIFSDKSENKPLVRLLIGQCAL